MAESRRSAAGDRRGPEAPRAGGADGGGPVRGPARLRRPRRPGLPRRPGAHRSRAHRRGRAGRAAAAGPRDRGTRPGIGSSTARRPVRRRGVAGGRAARPDQARGACASTAAADCRRRAAVPSCDGTARRRCVRGAGPAGAGRRPGRRHRAEAVRPAVTHRPRAAGRAPVLGTRLCRGRLGPRGPDALHQRTGAAVRDVRDRGTPGGPAGRDAVGVVPHARPAAGPAAAGGRRLRRLQAARCHGRPEPGPDRRQGQAGRLEGQGPGADRDLLAHPGRRREAHSRRGPGGIVSADHAGAALLPRQRAVRRVRPGVHAAGGDEREGRDFHGPFRQRQADAVDVLVVHLPALPEGDPAAPGACALSSG